MMRYSLAVLIFAIGCSSTPAPRTESGKTIEIAIENLPEWPASHATLATAEAAVSSALRRFDLQVLHIQALSAEGLQSPTGEYFISDHRTSNPMGGFIDWTSAWPVKHNGAAIEARTEVTFFAQNRRTIRVDIFVASWHPSATSSNYPRTLFDAIQRKLIEELPKALKEAGLITTVHYVDTKFDRAK